MKRFQNKTVLVTGGSSGIGLATARRLAQEGARVILIARDNDRLQIAVRSLEGTSHLAKSCDVSSESEVKEAFSSVKENVGQLDAAIHCAGAHAIRPFAIAKSQHFEDLFRNNVLSAVHSTKAFASLANPNGSSLVLLSSASAVLGSAGVSAYATAKGAILSLARSLASELAAKKIRVNTVVPGVVKTPMTDAFWAQLKTEQQEAIAKAHKLGLGEPEDVAAAIAFLASDDARWVTGAQLVVDGGLTLH